MRLFTYVCAVYISLGVCSYIARVYMCIRACKYVTRSSALYVTVTPTERCNCVVLVVAERLNCFQKLSTQERGCQCGVLVECARVVMAAQREHPHPTGGIKTPIRRFQLMRFFDLDWKKSRKPTNGNDDCVYDKASVWVNRVDVCIYRERERARYILRRHNGS